MQKLHYSNKWRIEIKEGANNDGVARFEVTPKGEATIPVTVTIKEGRSENGVAADVKKAFKAALDAKRFHVEGDDGEDVLVKRKSGPDFSIKLVESTLQRHALRRRARVNEDEKQGTFSYFHAVKIGECPRFSSLPPLTAAAAPRRTSRAGPSC